MTENTGTRSGAALVGESADEPMVRVENLHHSYGTGAVAVHALRGASFELRRGELVALKGRSGSGKTTLLHLIGGLDRPDRGRVLIDGTDLLRHSVRTSCWNCAATASATSSSPSTHPRCHRGRERGSAAAAAQSRPPRT